MIEYNDQYGYDMIQKDILSNFHNYINKNNNDIKHIVIVGAYNGDEINTFLTNYPGSEIKAFEAYPQNYIMLYNNFKNNSKIKMYNIAISDQRGESNFYEKTDVGNGSILRPNIPSIKEVIKVETHRLDEYTTENIDLLWVDVQGAELKVLKGIDISKIDSLFLEVVKREVQIDAYENTTYLDQLIDYLKPTHKLHSIGLDKTKTSGNAFWVRNCYGA